MPAVVILILAVTVRAADGESGFILVSGASWDYNGLYKPEAGTHFQGIKPPNINGNYDYLWYDGRWKVGYGKTFNNRKYTYTAEGGQKDGPPTSGWMWRGEVDSRIKVEQLPSLDFTLNQTEADGGVFTVDGGVVCEHGPHDWVHLTLDRQCDKTIDCYNEMDERTCFQKNMNQPQTIILKGVGQGLAGVYVLQRWQGIGFYSRIGGRGFIYQPSSEKGLIIGSGESVWTATAIYRREEQTVWISVGDGRLASEVQLTPVPDAFKSLLENRNNFEEEKTIAEVGIICLSPKNHEKTFIAFNDIEAGWCDMTWHCQFGGA